MQGVGESYKGVRSEGVKGEEGITAARAHYAVLLSACRYQIVGRPRWGRFKTADLYPASPAARDDTGLWKGEVSDFMIRCEKWYDTS